MATIRVREWTKEKINEIRDAESHSSHDSVIKSLLKDRELAKFAGARSEPAGKASPTDRDAPADRAIDEMAVVDGIARAVARHGPVQICVPNAGVAEGRALHKTDMAFWRSMMNTNIDGTFLTIRESLKSMHDTGWGRVIAISSIAGLRGLKGAPCYTASKHAVVGLIRGLAADYLGKPYTFNAICPAYVDTDIVPQNIDRIMARTGLARSRGERRHGRGQPAWPPDPPRGSGRSGSLAVRPELRQRQWSSHPDRRRRDVTETCDPAGGMSCRGRMHEIELFPDLWHLRTNL